MRFDPRPFLSLAAAALAVVAAVAPHAAARQDAGHRSYTNPVLPGDHADPSVVQVGRDYYATATSSEWEPEFVIYHSRDLVNWEPVGAVFPTRPAWAVGNFWAPEISYRDGTFFVYYVGRKAGGVLSVAVATARRAEGPWTDHGPLVGQPDGSIDPVTADDGRGTRYLIWKEDGNSRNRPTPLWAQPLSADGLKLEGEPKELFRNDVEWEGNLVEAPYVLRRGDWFYLFYAGNACCGRGCDYAVGVARSKSLLGPYEKNPANPILDSTDDWRCPGHGSVVSGNGRDYFLYHAYRPAFGPFVGREALLDEIRWGDDGWPKVGDGSGPSVTAHTPFDVPDRHDGGVVDVRFSASRLAEGFQWPQGRKPAVAFAAGALALAPKAGEEEGVLARPTVAVDYDATATIDAKGGSGTASLSAYGDAENALGVGLRDGKLVVWRRAKNETEELVSSPAPKGSAVEVRMTATEGRRYAFFVRDGATWAPLGKEVDGDYLPPWDRGVRVALVATGKGSVARFRSLAVVRRPLAAGVSASAAGAH